MIVTLESKQYQKRIHATKYLKVGKNNGLDSLFLCRNESLHLEGGRGVTVAICLRMLSNFKANDCYKLAVCHNPDNNIILLETLALENN